MQMGMVQIMKRSNYTSWIPFFTFDLPNLSEEASDTIIYHLYAIVESANTACIPTLSPDEKKSDKNHRNIDRRVSPSIYIGTCIFK